MKKVASNKIISEMTAKIFEHDSITKFLYYTDKQYEYEDILSKPKVSPGKLINKKMFINRRIPEPMLKSGAYIALRIYDYGFGRTGRKFIKQMLVDVDIIVHQECNPTIYGSRDNILIDLVQDALSSKLPSSVGECEVKRTYDILGLNVEYNGFTVRMKVDVFDKK